MIKAEVQIFILTIHQGADKRKMIPFWKQPHLVAKLFY